jgi:predicted phage-related endonuclease
MAARAKTKTKPRARKRATAPRATVRRRRPVKQHGTEAGYRAGCKCDRCRAAATAARRERQERATRGQTLERLQHELKTLQNLATVPGLRAAVPRETYDAYVAARVASDAAALELLRAELELKRAIGDAEIFTVDRHRVGTWETFTRTFFDTARFRKEHPAQYERYQREGTTRRFSVDRFASTPPERRVRARVRGQQR